MIAIAQQGETVSAICWRDLGRTAGAVEQVLAANPGLADLGPGLPGGTLVVLPEAGAIAPERRETVKLWD